MSRLTALNAGVRQKMRACAIAWSRSIGHREATPTWVVCGAGPLIA
jgi:hypothetical protein